MPRGSSAWPAAEPVFGVVVVRSTSAAMRGEKLLLAAGHEAKVIDVPRSISTDCCLGVRCRWDSREQVREILDEAALEVVRIHPLSY